MSKYANKRMHVRSANGRFRQPNMADLGITGTCPVCGHFLMRFYDGDRDGTPDPRRFRGRCWTCEPETDTERVAREADEARHAKPSIIDFLNGVFRDED